MDQVMLEQHDLRDAYQLENPEGREKQKKIHIVHHIILHPRINLIRQPQQKALLSAEQPQTKPDWIVLNSHC